MLVLLGLILIASTMTQDTTRGEYNPNTDEIKVIEQNNTNLISPISDQAVIYHEDFHKWQDSWMPVMGEIYWLGGLVLVTGLGIGLLTLDPKYFGLGGLAHLLSQGFVEIPAYWVTAWHYPNISLVIGGLMYLIFPIIILLFGFLINWGGYIATGDETILNPYVAKFFDVKLES